MAFNVAAEAYDRFMGRYSTLLSSPLADVAGVQSGQRALDVGCGTGALTAELVARLGPGSVVAVDPSQQFVDTVRQRQPDVEVQLASAEALPFDDGQFDATLAQLVVHFMADPVAGIAEMARVTRPGGVVAACVWDYGGGQDPLSAFWAAARDLDPTVAGEDDLAGAREGHLAELFDAAGLQSVEATELWVSLEHPSFEAWWEPFTMGVGPAGKYLGGLEAEQRDIVREHARRRLPDAPFVVRARAWAARGLSAGRG